ncbi:alpha/beta-hydrolase [Westerdykella ornata]|uniref:Alpha/beta-hydrolase n=1 Tax=Westerdykella ornata TaxID=318751 RepID=A0A6A6JA43_WESOR|nr:alpha/beta-hydrolase [Westerdykella ornata]KAF2273043.1 alpha/beta-hydrolase [Westerdykella ornata]
MPFGPFILQWRTPSPNPPAPTPLPPGITRTYIPTSAGPLELLSSLPSSTSDPTQPERPPLFFAHGGFGCAFFWVPYMQFFSARGYPCYAVSYRGHGGSWYPGLLRMYFAPRSKLVEDLVDGVKYAEGLEKERRGGKEDVKAVLIAHSNGGQLAQYALSRGLVTVGGYCHFAAVPAFGSFSCYKFWAPTAIFHMYYRCFHPRYILASIKQVKDAFFLPSTPDSQVQEFSRLLSPYESMLWAPQGLFAFVTGPDVLRSIAGWRVGGPDRMLVLAAERDVLCTPALLRDAAARYRAGLEKMIKSKEVEGEADREWEGVRFRFVNGLPHHLQNSEEWERGAEEVLEWVEQL